MTSDAVNRLSWPAEVFYRRLHSVVDDYGRYDGRPAILRAVLYPLKLDRVSESDIAKWTREAEEAGLVRLYAVEGKDYLEVVKFGQRLRAEKSKFPPPPTSAGIRMRMLPEAYSESYSESYSEKDGSAPVPGAPPAIEIPCTKGQAYAVSEEQVSRWSADFPAVDVPQALRAMRAWTEANPVKRKTKRGCPAFIVRWLSKEQDRGRSENSRIVSAKPTPASETEREFREAGILPN